MSCRVRAHSPSNAAHSQGLTERLSGSGVLLINEIGGNDSHKGLSFNLCDEILLILPSAAKPDLGLHALKEAPQHGLISSFNASHRASQPSTVVLRRAINKTKE